MKSILFTLFIISIFGIWNVSKCDAQDAGGAKKKEITYEELLNKLPKTPQALDAYNGDLAQLLSDILAKAPNFTVMYDNNIPQFKVHGESANQATKLTVDNDGNVVLIRQEKDREEFFSHDGTMVENTTITERTQTSKVKLKRFNSILVEIYPSKPLEKPGITHSSIADKEAYEILFHTLDNVKAVSLHSHFKTLKGLTSDEAGKEVNADVVVSNMYILIPCDDEQADLIAKAFQKLISLHGGKTDYENQIHKKKEAIPKTSP